MKLNIYREITLEPSDYIQFLKNEIEFQPYLKFSPRLETTHGILVESELPKVGLYLIYKIINGDYQLLYIGSSDNSIHNRLSRYVAAARDTQRFDENHAGGEKHRKIFGEDLENMYVKYINFDFSSLKDVTLVDLENILIERLEPIFNSENYSKYVFQTKFEIIRQAA